MRLVCCLFSKESRQFAVWRTLTLLGLCWLALAAGVQAQQLEVQAVEYREFMSPTGRALNYRWAGPEVPENADLLPNFFVLDDGTILVRSTVKVGVPGLTGFVFDFPGDTEGLQTEIDILPNIAGAEFTLAARVISTQMFPPDPENPAAGPYVLGAVERSTLFLLDKKSTMHIAISPDGEEYLLAAIERNFASTVDFEDPDALADFFLPPGWTYRICVTTAEQEVVADGVAEVLFTFAAGPANPIEVALFQKLTEPLKCRGKGQVNGNGGS